MSNEIIVVKQLPIIEQQLAQIKEQVAERVSAAMQLVCTESTVKEIKKARAELNAEFKAWEDKRKEVKNAVMSPYEQFEAVYKDCISDAYKAADKDLKQKVDEVEQELKNQKLSEVQSYFEEYLASKGIDFVTYEQAGINVTLSASLKSLKEAAKTFID
jgi:predicted secreted protein